MLDIQKFKMPAAITLGAIFSIIMIEYPRSFAFLPAVFALIYLSFQAINSKALPAVSLKSVIPLLAVLVLSFSSILWSVDSEVSQERSIKLLPLMFAGFVLMTWSLNQPINKHQSTLYFYGLAIMIAIGALITTFELNADKALYRLLRDVPEGGKVNYAVYNRGTVILTLLMFSLLGYFLYFRRSIKILCALFLSVILLMAHTHSQSSQLALALGLVFFFLFPHHSKPAWYVMIGLIGLLILSAPFITPWLYSHAEFINSLPFLGGNMGYAGPRLEIWDYVARYALDNPLLGYGIESTKIIEDFDSRQIYLDGNSILHPHNFALQLWVEFGVIGAILGASLISWLLWRISMLPNKVDKQVCLSSLIAILSISATGYGIWQSWWIGTVFLTVATIVYFVRLEKQSNK